MGKRRSLGHRTIRHEYNMPLNEADTCRRYVVPKLQAAGWETELHRLSHAERQARARRPGEGYHSGGLREDYLLALRALMRQGNTDP